jgi:putative ATPase
VGEGKLLRRAIEADKLFSSIILWGPPGTGKTTLAQVIANTTRSHFVTISAILAGKADLRELVAAALERRRLHNERTILFVDEVHRWNKAQQDALLPHVENGTVTLIGATTENPYFEVIKALISRSRVFQLRNLNQEETGILIDRALSDRERGYGDKLVRLDPAARSHLIEVASGDARNALNAIELAVESTAPDKDGAIHITLDVAQESIQRRAVLYDKDRRLALRHDQRLHQVGARLGPGRSALLAGQDVVRRRGSALHPAPPDHPGRKTLGWPIRMDCWLYPPPPRR